MERMNLTAARPLLAIKTEWKGRLPPQRRTRSSRAAAVSAERLGTPRRAVLELQRGNEAGERGLEVWKGRSKGSRQRRRWAGICCLEVP